MPLNQIKETNNIVKKIPTGKKQTSWLFSKRDRGFDLETTENQISPVKCERDRTGPKIHNDMRSISL